MWFTVIAQQVPTLDLGSLSLASGFGAGFLLAVQAVMKWRRNGAGVHNPLLERLATVQESMNATLTKVVENQARMVTLLEVLERKT